MTILFLPAVWIFLWEIEQAQVRIALRQLKYAPTTLMGRMAGIGTEEFQDYHSYCLLTIPGPTQSTNHEDLRVKARNFNIELNYG